MEGEHALIVGTGGGVGVGVEEGVEDTAELPTTLPAETVDDTEAAAPAEETTTTEEAAPAAETEDTADSEATPTTDEEAVPTAEAVPTIEAEDTTEEATAADEPEAAPTTEEAAAPADAEPVIALSNCQTCTNTPTKNMIKRSYDCTTAIQALAVQCRDDAGWRAGNICEFSCYKAGRGYAHTDVSLEGTRCCEEGEEPLKPEVLTTEEVQTAITPEVVTPVLGEVDDTAEVAREQDEPTTTTPTETATTDEQPAATTATESDIAESAEQMMLEEATMAEEAIIGDAPSDAETTDATTDEPQIEVVDQMVVDMEPASEATDAADATTEEADETTMTTEEVTTVEETTTTEEGAPAQEDMTTPSEEATATDVTIEFVPEEEGSTAPTETPEATEATVMTAENNYDGTTEPMCGPTAAGALCPFAADGSMKNCCSSYGFCGQTAAYCGAGCQAGFGRCDDVPATTEATEIDDEMMAPADSTEGTAEPTSAPTAETSTETTEGEMDDATTPTPEMGDLMPGISEIAREDDAGEDESNGLRGSTAASAYKYADSAAPGVQVTTGVVAVLGAASAVLLGML